MHINQAIYFHQTLRKNIFFKILFKHLVFKQHAWDPKRKDYLSVV